MVPKTFQVRVSTLLGMKSYTQDCRDSASRCQLLYMLKNTHHTPLSAYNYMIKPTSCSTVCICRNPHHTVCICWNPHPPPLFVPAEIHIILCLHLLKPTSCSTTCWNSSRSAIGVCWTLHHTLLSVYMPNPSLGSIICMYYAEPLHYLYGHVKPLITFHYLNIYWTPHQALLFPLYVLHCCRCFLKHKWSFSLHRKYAVVHFGAKGRPRVT